MQLVQFLCLCGGKKIPRLLEKADKASTFSTSYLSLHFPSYGVLSACPHPDKTVALRLH